MNPLVDPSAYREQMSPMCRKLDSLSDIFDAHGEHLQRRARGGKKKTKQEKVKSCFILFSQKVSNKVGKNYLFMITFA